jgi:hypothetical protein
MTTVAETLPKTVRMSTVTMMAKQVLLDREYRREAISGLYLFIHESARRKHREAAEERLMLLITAKVREQTIGRAQREERRLA